MTEAELRINLLAWAKSYCRNPFTAGTPAGVLIFIDGAVSFFNNSPGKTSESLGDYSVSFDATLPDSLKELLRPYKKLGVIS
jgi:hypothetical protein